MSKQSLTEALQGADSCVAAALALAKYRPIANEGMEILLDGLEAYLDRARAALRAEGETP